jgi:hypothetical protein
MHTSHSTLRSAVLPLLALLAVTWALTFSAPAAAQSRAAPCSLDSIAAAMGRTAADLSEAEKRELSAWCRKQQAGESSASKTPAAGDRVGAAPDGSTDRGVKHELNVESWSATGGSTSGPVGDRTIDVLSADGSDGTEIWCGKNNCVCWKGPKYDGCHHVDKLCTSDLKCIGRVCGCQAQ